jgi:hypothetical protein
MSVAAVCAGPSVLKEKSNMAIPEILSRPSGGKLDDGATLKLNTGNSCDKKDDVYDCDGTCYDVTGNKYRAWKVCF